MKEYTVIVEYEYKFTVLAHSEVDAKYKAIEQVGNHQPHYADVTVFSFKEKKDN